MGRWYIEQLSIIIKIYIFDAFLTGSRTSRRTQWEEHHHQLRSFFSAQFKNSPYLEWRQRAPASSSIAKGFSDPLECLHTLKDDPQWSFLGQKKEGAAAAAAAAADGLLKDSGRPGRGERGDGRRRSPHVDYWKCAKDWILLQLLQQEEDLGGGTETRQRKSSGWSSRARKTTRNYFGYCCCCRLLQTPLPSSYFNKKPITKYTTKLDSRHNQLWAHICVLPDSSPHILLFHIKAESRHAAEKERKKASSSRRWSLLATCCGNWVGGHWKDIALALPFLLLLLCSAPSSN